MAFGLLKQQGVIGYLSELMRLRDRQPRLFLELFKGQINKLIAYLARKGRIKVIGRESLEKLIEGVIPDFPYIEETLRSNLIASEEGIPTVEG